MIKIINLFNLFFIKTRLNHLVKYLLCKDKFINTYTKSHIVGSFSNELFHKYKSKFSNKKSYSSIWKKVLSDNYKDIYDAYSTNDLIKFKEILNNFFQEKCIRGAEDGDLYKKYFFQISHKYLLIQSIYKLAEYLSYKKIVNPYQISQENHKSSNIVNFYKSFSENFPIKEIPNVGSPYGMKIDKGVINYRFVESLYFNFEIKNFLMSQRIFQNKKIKILELGSGSGINILVTINFHRENIEKIYLVDLPEMLLFQEFFLKNSLNERDFSKIEFITSDEFENKNLSYNILINKDSLPEISQSQADLYMRNFNNRHDCYFFSINQESSLKEQNPVSELLKKYKNIHRVSRDLFPLREGYVKEVFISKLL